MTQIVVVATVRRPSRVELQDLACTLVNQASRGRHRCVCYARTVIAWTIL